MSNQLSYQMGISKSLHGRRPLHRPASSSSHQYQRMLRGEMAIHQRRVVSHNSSERGGQSVTPVFKRGSSK